MLSQPRTVDDDEKTALSGSTSHSGKRFKISSSAIRPSIRASTLPRQDAAVWPSSAVELDVAGDVTSDLKRRWLVVQLVGPASRHHCCPPCDHAVLRARAAGRGNARASDGRSAQ